MGTACDRLQRVEHEDEHVAVVLRVQQPRPEGRLLGVHEQLNRERVNRSEHASSMVQASAGSQGMRTDHGRAALLKK